MPFQAKDLHEYYRSELGKFEWPSCSVSHKQNRTFPGHYPAEKWLFGRFELIHPRLFGEKFDDTLCNFD